MSSSFVIVWTMEANVVVNYFTFIFLYQRASEIQTDSHSTVIICWRHGAHFFIIKIFLILFIRIYIRIYTQIWWFWKLHILRFIVYLLAMQITLSLSLSLFLVRETKKEIIKIMKKRKANLKSYFHIIFCKIYFT